MKNLTIERTVNAPRSAVWAVLADFPNISAWNSGVHRSDLIGDATEGVGAIRVCELDGNVSMRETVTQWTAEQTMKISIDDIQKMPVKEAAMTFVLADAGAGTKITMSYDFAPKGGPFAGVLAAMMAKPMNKGFNGFIDDLEAAARA